MAVVRVAFVYDNYCSIVDGGCQALKAVIFKFG